LVPRNLLLPDVVAEDLDAVLGVLNDFRPSVVVNAIGIVKQRAESADPIPVLRVNSLFPHHVYQGCQSIGARLIHLSTDCVFSGRKGNYAEDDEPDPVDLYGRTKLLGEVSGPGAITLRTSMIGPELGEGTGLVSWFLRQRGQSANLYSRAIFSGLTTHELSRVISRVVANRELEGLWNVASTPISKYELLEALNKRLASPLQLVDDPSLVIDRSLDGSRFRDRLDYTTPSWSDMLDELAGVLASREGPDSAQSP
jgi:dTDP-4-dehydrorhamnose reductase